jgi:putative ABC transport system ATP-binding protein
VLTLCEVEKIYGAGQGYRALSNVTLDVRAGEFCALVGPSGSGKSTLMNLIGMLDRPTSGSIQLHGQDVGQLSKAESAKIRNANIGFIFQAFHLLPRLTASENVALPLLYRGLGEQREHSARVIEALTMVGLSDRAQSKPDELSGGQRQRVAIARALVGEPSFLLADEPTGSLDSKTAATIMDLFGRLNAELGLTIIMVTHDAGLAAECGRQIELLDGRIVRDTMAPT